MAAAILESVAISRPGVVAAARPPRAAAVTVALAAPLRGRCSGLQLLPRFKGLRVALPSSRAQKGSSPAAVVGSKVFSRRTALASKAQEMGVELPEVSKATWQSMVLDSEIPVLIDFWAPWCGPCRLIEPNLVKLAKTYKGKLKFYKLNTDENPELATRYGIRSIPTMMIFKSGEKKDAVIGAVPETTLFTYIDKFI